jgi:hypothetical protein
MADLLCKRLRGQQGSRELLASRERTFLAKQLRIDFKEATR